MQGGNDILKWRVNSAEEIRYIGGHNKPQHGRTKMAFVEIAAIWFYDTGELSFHILDLTDVASSCCNYRIDVFVRHAHRHIDMHGLDSRDQTTWGITSFRRRPYFHANVSVAEAGPFELHIRETTVISYNNTLT